MIEQDSEGETYIVISNKDFSLTTGKKYYVSVSTEDPAKGNANWGTPAEVCSVYSNWFEMISQHPVITDTDGKIVTDYKIPCDAADDYEIKSRDNWLQLTLIRVVRLHWMVLSSSGILMVRMKEIR